MHPLILFAVVTILGRAPAVSSWSNGKTDNEGSSEYHRKDTQVPYIDRPRFFGKRVVKNEGTQLKQVYDEIKNSLNDDIIRSLSDEDIADDDDIVVYVPEDYARSLLESGLEEAEDEHQHKDEYITEVQPGSGVRERFTGYWNLQDNKVEDATGKQEDSQRKHGPFLGPSVRGRFGRESQGPRWSRFGRDQRWARFGRENHKVFEPRTTNDADVNEVDQRWGRFGGDATTREDELKPRWGRFGREADAGPRWSRYGREVDNKPRWGRFGREAKRSETASQPRWSRFGRDASTLKRSFGKDAYNLLSTDKRDTKDSKSNLKV